MNNTPKKILIVFGFKSSRSDQFITQLSNHFKNENTKISIGYFSELGFVFDDNKIQVTINGTDIREFGLVYIRKAGTNHTIIANTLGICLKALGIQFYDSVFGEYGGKGNKLRAIAQLFVSRVPTPKTVYYCSPKVSNKFDELSLELGLPFVAKDIGMQRGKGIFLVNTIDDLESLPNLKGNNGKSVYLFQKLIQKKHEYRTVILGNEVGVWYEKFAGNEAEFRFNTSLGATEVYLNEKEVPANLSLPAIIAAKALKLEVAGVDIVVEKDTNKVYILEANRAPGLTRDELLSPEFRLVAEFLEREVWQSKKQ
jgi:RimK-like ATP-grasp domain